MKEIVGDIFGRVRTPTPALPDLNNEEICREEFERKNKKYNLYYNSLVMKWFRHLENDLYQELQTPEENRYWDMNVDYFEGLIE